MTCQRTGEALCRKWDEDLPPVMDPDDNLAGKNVYELNAMQKHAQGSAATPLQVDMEGYFEYSDGKGKQRRLKSDRKVRAARLEVPPEVALPGSEPAEAGALTTSALATEHYAHALATLADDEVRALPTNLSTARAPIVAAAVEPSCLVRSRRGACAFAAAAPSWAARERGRRGRGRAAGEVRSVGGRVGRRFRRGLTVLPEDEQPVRKTNCFSKKRVKQLTVRALKTYVL